MKDFDRNPFAELLMLMSMADLKAWRKRSRDSGNRWLAGIMDDEIQERNMSPTYERWQNEQQH